MGSGFKVQGGFSCDFCGGVAKCGYSTYSYPVMYVLRGFNSSMLWVRRAEPPNLERANGSVAVLQRPATRCNDSVL